MVPTPTALRVGAAWLAGALVAASLAGCGSAADGAAAQPTPTQDAGADSVAACDALLESDRLLIDPGSPVFHDVLRALGEFAQTISTEVRPLDGAVADDAARLVAAIDDAILDGSTKDLVKGQEFGTLTQRLRKWGYDHCGFEKLDIASTDFLYEGVPDTLAAGNYAISLKNTGRNQHMVMLVKIASDITGNIDSILGDLTDAVNDGDVEIVVAGAPARSGQTGYVTATLDPGRYVLFCPVRADNGNPHYKHGLKHQFAVE